MGLAWMSEALCAAFVNLPWIAEPEDSSASARRSMGLVCDLCPVRSECSEYVRDEHIVSGFWAGADRSEQDPWSRSGGAA